ncbi:hypothetical protein [Candidatus Ruminimicrobium bovinum]|uniref:hypothetical protein n=1 Tax=Candidatus Ruminimicrobium bovinum TaxID=3242779 RepID=UPI0039B95CB9
MKNLILILLCFVLFCSCSVLDYPKRIAGYSVANFENEREGRFAMDINLPAQKAYNKCNLFIFEKHLKTNFKNDKKLYVVASQCSLLYEFCLDSTEVGFFVKEKDDKSSTIEIISNNVNLAKFIFQKFKDYNN